MLPRDVDAQFKPGTASHRRPAQESVGKGIVKTERCDALVIVRIFLQQITDQFLFEVYKPYLTSDFTLVAETQWWRLYRRLKPAPAASSDPNKD